MNTCSVVRWMVMVLLIASVSTAMGVELKKDMFTISLPSGWVEIPDDTIDAYEKEVARSAPNVSPETYECGFQLESSGNWFTYPYILVQVKDTGRIAEHQFKEFETISLNKAAEEMKADMGSLLTDIQTDKMVYDKENHILWMRMEIKAANGAEVSGLIGMVPTEKGIIQVNNYCPKADYPKFEPIFRSVVISTKPDPELAYKVREANTKITTTKKIDWGKVLNKGLLGALAGGLIGGVVAYSIKRIMKSRQA